MKGSDTLVFARGCEGLEEFRDPKYGFKDSCVGAFFPEDHVTDIKHGLAVFVLCCFFSSRGSMHTTTLPIWNQVRKDPCVLRFGGRNSILVVFM